MKKLAFATAAALAAVSAVPASAVTTSITLQPIGGTYNAVFGNTDPYATGQKYGFFNSLAKGTDVYNFTVPTNGDLYGFVGSVGLYLTLTNLDFTSVMLDNGIAFNKVSDGVFELQTLAASRFWPAITTSRSSITMRRSARTTPASSRSTRAAARCRSRPPGR